MTMRLLATAAAAALVVGATAASTSAAPSTMRSCGTIKAGGASWSVVSADFPCRAGTTLVRKLAAKPHSLYTKFGTFLGLKCVEIAGNAKREIACVSSDGRRSVYGVTKEDG